MMKVRKTIKEWEMEVGIKIKHPTGFGKSNNKNYTWKYTEEQFRRRARKSFIVCKTEKALKFLKG